MDTSTPEGVEIDIVLYMTGDAGIEAVFAMRGCKLLPSHENIERAVECASKELDEIIGPNARLMTNDEVREYKANECAEAREGPAPLDEEEWD